MKESLLKKSLEKLTSPEQLDRLLVIIRLPGWIALFTLFGLILCILIWSIFARISMTTNGIGIFFQPELIELIQNHTESNVLLVQAKQGDEVKQNDVLIELSSPQLFWEEKENQKKIKILEQTIFREEKNDLEKKAIELKQHEAVYALQKKRLKELEAEPNQQQALYDLQVVMTNQEALIKILKENQRIFGPTIQNYYFQLQDLNQQKIRLNEQIKNLMITAPSDGTIMAVEVLPGEQLVPGKNLIWFQKKVTNQNEQFIYAFFPIKHADSIAPGMKVLMQFNSVNASLYGKMKGTVTKIFAFTPTTRGGILKSIPSDKLKEYLIQEEATVAVEIQPIQGQTLSGYQWTTPQGPPNPITFGAVAQVEVIMEQKRPITYLIPLHQHE